MSVGSYISVIGLKYIKCPYLAPKLVPLHAMPQAQRWHYDIPGYPWPRGTSFIYPTGKYENRVHLQWLHARNHNSNQVHVYGIYMLMVHI